MTSLDLQALTIMANVGLKQLSIKKVNISPEEKAINAAVSIASVYNEEKEWLSKTARTLYYIDIKGLQKGDYKVKGIVH